jgi:hypothetical protein
MKGERRQLIKQLPPENAVNVLLACYTYLETREAPQNLSQIEEIAFSVFLPDLEEAWEKYNKRVFNGTKGGRPSKE